MLEESKKYVTPGRSSCVSLEYSLESERGSNLRLREIVVLRHALDAVTAEVSVRDYVRGDGGSGDQGSAEAYFRIDDYRRVVIFRKLISFRRPDARKERQDTLRSAMNAAQKVSDHCIKRPLSTGGNVNALAFVKDVH